MVVLVTCECHALHASCKRFPLATNRGDASDSSTVPQATIASSCAANNPIGCMCCRHAACMEMVQQKNGPDCAAVLRAMLHATISYETESKVSHLI